MGRAVRLRRVEHDDLPRFAAWLNDPEVREGLAMVYPVSVAGEEQWFEAMQRREPAEQQFAIDALSGGGGAVLHIGILGFRVVDWKNSHAELGIFIGDKAFWGRGFGTDAVRTLVAWAFDELNMHRVWLKVFEDNRRAIRAYEKVGFRHEGRLREERFHAGRYSDTLVMGLLRTEFEA
jgi:RimJ/RimL family protein N-acetyltransferase